MNLLTINAGSSSIKYKVFQTNNQSLVPLFSGLIEGIGEQTGAWRHGAEASTHSYPDHGEAFRALAQKLKHELQAHSIQGVGHRVVHGGEAYFQPTLITKQVLQKIRDLAPLAPIHNPINALGIEFAQQQFPTAHHVAVFDSGFHHTIPPHIHHYAIHTETAERYQIKRYGFHGINHEYVAKQAAIHLNKPLEQCNLISLHLGNGASACLIKQGQSYDTTMGMTPLAGLVMGTRCGDIDPAIPLYLQQQGMSIEQVDILLNKQSGLKGIAADNDMRQLTARAQSGDAKAILALDMYVYSIQKIIGAYKTQVAVLDALIFTGGIGENASIIREKTIRPLSHLDLQLDLEMNSSNHAASNPNLSKEGTPIFVIRGDEEYLIAHHLLSTIHSLNF